MPRIEGPDPPLLAPFMRSDVEMWLKAAFRAMPFTPIYAPRGNTLHAAAADIPDATFDILAFSGTVLGDKSEARKVLLVWARSVATKGDVGGSISEFCRSRSGKMSRAKFDRIRVRACEQIAEAKNRLEGRSVAPR